MDFDFMKIFEWIGMLTGLLTSIYTISLAIPGEQPDKLIKWLLDITEKMSKK